MEDCHFFATAAGKSTLDFSRLPQSKPATLANESAMKPLGKLPNSVSDVAV
jgi:hypothetical protein